VRSIVRGPARALVGSGQIVWADREHIRLDAPAADESLDSAANRAILFILRALITRANDILTRLSNLKEVTDAGESDTVTALATRWPRRRQCLEDLIVQLRRVSRQLPFPAVSRPETTAAGLTAVAADAVYARAWGRGWRALRRDVGEPDALDRMWLSPTWEIYERWSFLRVGQLLAEHLPGWNWRLRMRAGVWPSPGEYWWEGASNERQARLQLQPTFRNSEAERAGRWSVSKERVPDIVLTVADKGETKFLVLDAKYRVTRPNVLDAVQSAHIYQDALRIGPKRPEASLLLVPRVDEAAWLADRQFVADHRVGIHPMRAGSGQVLPASMVELLT
jgi:hypothetical protein